MSNEVSESKEVVTDVKSPGRKILLFLNIWVILLTVLMGICLFADNVVVGVGIGSLYKKNLSFIKGLNYYIEQFKEPFDGVNILGFFGGRQFFLASLLCFIIPVTMVIYLAVMSVIRVVKLILGKLYTIKQLAKQVTTLIIWQVCLLVAVRLFNPYGGFWYGEYYENGTVKNLILGGAWWIPMILLLVSAIVLVNVENIIEAATKGVKLGKRFVGYGMYIVCILSGSMIFAPVFKLVNTSTIYGKTEYAQGFLDINRNLFSYIAGYDYLSYEENLNLWIVCTALNWIFTVGLFVLAIIGIKKAYNITVGEKSNPKYFIIMGVLSVILPIVNYLVYGYWADYDGIVLDYGPIVIMITGVVLVAAGVVLLLGDRKNTRMAEEIATSEQ